MAQRNLMIDDEALDYEGFTLVPDLVPADDLEVFEESIAEFCTNYLRRREQLPTGQDPFVAILQRDQEWRETLFPMLRNLWAVQRIAAHVGTLIESSGAFRRWGYEVPLVWPSFRADPPGEDAYLLPMHQDYGSTRCHRALRLWIPLRDADAEAGTMEVVHESHRLGPLEYDLSDPKQPHIPENQWGHLRVTTVEVPAGSGVLLNPLVVHRSVSGHSGRMKYVLLMQLQDMATIMDPADKNDDVGRAFRELTAKRAAAQLAAG